MRTAGELANLPDHPAMRPAAAYKKKFEAWLAARFAASDVDAPEALARHVVLLMEGAFSAMLVHRDASYAEAAGEAARTLVRQARG